MRKYLILLLAVALIAVSFAGCVKSAPATVAPAPVTSATIALIPPVVTDTIIPRDAPTSIVVDPIVGVWRYSTSDGYDDRYMFNADGTYVNNFHGPSNPTFVFSGTWVQDGQLGTGAQSGTTYTLTDSHGIVYTKVMDRQGSSIYDTNYPSVSLTRYSGTVTMA